jgi:hypothetical protein
MDYHFANETRCRLLMGAMDLSAAEQSNGKALNRTKAGAFAFFLLAGALLVASLLMPPNGQQHIDGAPGTTASTR